MQGQQKVNTLTKNIKEKENLIKISLALGMEPDPKLVKEVSEYRDLLKNIKTVGAEFNDFISSVKQLKVDPVVEQINIVDIPKPPTVDELLLEFAVEEEPQKEVLKEVLDIPKPPTVEELLSTLNVTQDEKTSENTLVNLAAKQIEKEAKLEEKSTFAQPDVPIENTINDLKKKVKLLEDWLAKVSATGPGSGEVNLLRLDDVDTRNLANNRFLKYNSANAKLEFADVSGGGASVTSINGEIGDVVLTTANVAETSNLYYTNARAVSAFTAGNNITIESNGLISANVTGGGSVDLTAVSSNIIPTSNSVFNLGAPDFRWKTLYLANNTIDLGGALIQSDGTGQIIISSSGAVLPVNSKVNIGNKQTEIALVSNAGSVSKVVPFYTQSTGLNTVATNFEFGTNKDDFVFTNFTLQGGTTLQQAAVAQFYF